MFANGFDKPFIDNMRHSHYNQIYRVFLQETVWHTLPVKVIVLYIENLFTSPSLVIEFYNLLVAHFPVIGHDKHILVAISSKGVDLTCFVGYSISHYTMSGMTKLIG